MSYPVESESVTRLLEMMYATIIDGHLITAKSVRALCQKLTNKGHNIPGVHYDVFDFYNETPVFSIRYDGKTDSWGKYVPEQTIPAHYEYIRDTEGLKPQGPPKVEP